MSDCCLSLSPFLSRDSEQTQKEKTTSSSTKSGRRRHTATTTRKTILSPLLIPQPSLILRRRNAHAIPTTVPLYNTITASAVFSEAYSVSREMLVKPVRRLDCEVVGARRDQYRFHIPAVQLGGEGEKKERTARKTTSPFRLIASKIAGAAVAAFGSRDEEEAVEEERDAKTMWTLR